jgi:chemotaxis protein histidine kinase CheA
MAVSSRSERSECEERRTRAKVKDEGCPLPDNREPVRPVRRALTNLRLMDPAFVWQSPSAPPPPQGWVTLDVAAGITGLSAKTIRNWARKQKITSKLMDDERVVLRSEVVERARKRAEAEASKQQKAAPSKKKSKKKRKAAAPSPPKEPPAAEPPAAPNEISGDGGEPPVQPPLPPVPEGSMLVPIDEWRRLLNQLGNLHEAGQQLADARERAAKAETEAHFLKERVRELRTRLEVADQPPPEPSPEPEPEPEPAIEHDDPGPLWLYLVRRWGTRGR